MNKDGKDIGNIGDGVELPRARRAIVVVVTIALVMVMMHHAEEERHAQVDTANYRCQPIIHQAGGNLDLRRKNVKRQTTYAPGDVTGTGRGLV